MATNEAYQAKQFKLSGLQGISDQTLEMHFKLYEGYVKETNRLTEKISEFLKDGQEVSMLINTETDLPMGVELPDKIVMKVTYSEPGMKGDTATRTLKPATVETGATVNVPLFVNEGELIRINTKTGEYVERVKE